ncbi:ABC transporter permease [Candidatus Saccharibacteria bacterium]|nr:ABC transporter permease [Candidatus Saccharibacteria bacterium]
MTKKNMLRRKMLRDMRKNFSQFITIFLMLLIGMMAYSGIKAYMTGMQDSADKYYAENNLQDLDAFGKLTDNDVEQIKNIRHINNAEGKLSFLTEVKNLNERDLQLNFIKTNEISKFHVIKGEAFDVNKSGLWLDQYFAKENNLKLGDELEFEQNDIKLKEKIIGLVYVPDHLAYVKDETEIFPAHDKYGFAYLSQNELPEAMRFYSSIMIDVDEESNRNAAKTAITDEVDNVVSVLNTKDQYSAASYQSEIDEGKTYVGIFSGLFIAIALLCVVTTMARIVRKDRTQIGVMKALGFSDKRITWHYISYALFLAVLGALAGILLGNFAFGKVFIDMEAAFFEVANIHTSTDSSIWFMGIFTVVITCFVCYLTVRGYTRQPAAEILRVERPKVKSRSLRFTTSGLFKKLSFASRWNIRDIIRNKARTLTGIVGVIGCMVLLVCGLGIRDTIDNYLDIELTQINHYKNRLYISEEASGKQIEKLFDDYSHDSSQTLGIEIKRDGELKAKTIFVNDAGDSVRVLDENWNKMELSSDGIYMTRKLAETEGYKVGDEIEWHIMGSHTYYRTKIVGLNRDPQSQNLTMTRAFYESLDLEYKPDSIYTDKAVEGLPNGTDSVQAIDKVRDGMNQMLDTMMTMVVMLIVFAALLGAIIIYNMGILSFSEKDYQFSTLKVLGFSDRKIGRIFIQQNLWIAVIAIIIGLPAGYGVVNYIFTEAIGDMYDFSIAITLTTSILSALGTFIVSLVVSAWLTRRVAKIDMVKSLKANE